MSKQQISDEERLKNLKREAHEEMQALKEAIKEARTIRQEITDNLENGIEALIAAFLTPKLREMRQRMDESIDLKVEQIYSYFDRITKILDHGGSKSNPSLEELITQAVERAGGLPDPFDVNRPDLTGIEVQMVHFDDGLIEGFSEAIKEHYDQVILKMSDEDKQKTFDRVLPRLTTVRPEMSQDDAAQWLKEQLRMA